MSPLKPFLLGSCFAFLCLPSISQAEIYRWVDDQGKVHYSDKKEDAGRNPTSQVNTRSPAAKQTPPQDANYWAGQEADLKRRRMMQEEQDKQEAEARRRAALPKSLSGGRFGDTDQEKCNFAKDVLNGSIRRIHGPPTDDNDRRVAQREVEKYCK